MENRKLSDGEITAKLASLHGWKMEEGKLLRVMTFGNFEDAFSFIARIALEIEKIDHHPEIRNEYSRVEIRLSTHKIRNPDGTVSSGISLLDFELAERIDAAASGYRLK
ncbi:MAG: 4a-hydroxytetrahydrobiopterin dehydratase [Candidatus Thermoplasmatota archaeon]|jgi:4a-hydroxytetrahydrobiopterin dehydratase|nr:4a-hydroxytetrahydrobiopterin dehydratase [Candidatus Thermoplasmatota archaeon]